MSLKLKYDFVNHVSLVAAKGPTLALTRATTASVTDYNNIIKQVASGEARYTGARRVENQLLRSAPDLSATWVLSYFQYTTGQADPDGGTSAIKWNPDYSVDPGGAARTIRMFQSISNTAIGDTVCLSVYLKPIVVTSSYIGNPDAADATLDLYAALSAESSGGGVSYFNLNTLAITKHASHTTAVLKDVGGGWYRAHITYTATILDTTNYNFLWFSNRTSTSSFDPYPDGLEEVDIYGFQHEEVSGQADTSPSEYQATTTAAVAKWYTTQQDGTALTTPVTGLLVEEARTNICLYSEDFTHASWVETNTDQPSSVTAPDGTLTAEEIAATSAADQAFGIYQAFTGRTAAEATTISCFLKAGVNATFAQLAYDSDGSGADGFFCNFNLSTGAAGTVTAMTAGTATESFISDVGNGWYKCSIVGSIAVGTVARMTIAITDIITAAKFEAANLADNDSIYAWGAEINAGSTALFPTSYIPTTTASVTRNQDALVAANVDWCDDAVGTYYIQASFDVQTDGGVLFQADNGSTPDRTNLTVHTYSQGRSTATVSVDAAIVSNFALVSGKWVPGGGNERAVMCYAEDDFEYYHDGVRTGTGDQSGTMVGNTITRFTVGGTGIAATETITGHIAEIRYYNTRLTNAQLADMSNGIFPPESGGRNGPGLTFGMMGRMGA